MARRNNRESNETQPQDDSYKKDYFVAFERLTPHQLKEAKESLLNTVAAALIQAPKVVITDLTIRRITKIVKRIAYYDPEFILKLALYVRDDLNIRSTANYLLSVASNIPECTPYLKKYFGSSVRLPSDWLDVAATYHLLPDKQLKGKAIPTALRKVMVDKFPAFDPYQLGKYNKERNIKRKAKKQKEEKAKNPTPMVKKAPEKPQLTIKQMIRLLHIATPPVNVMCLLGKKYPLTETQFKDANLPGQFEPERAGKRMKLPTPETWETLLSEKGNKAATWEELIEHKKLPFMAMLRNLRNLIFAGVHPRYHKWAQNKLSNPGSVASSRQFPFRFFSAYEVIPKDLEHFKQMLTGQNEKKTGKPGEQQVRRKKKKPVVPAIMPSDKTFEDYRKALDQSVKLATIHNVQPIRGSTVVFCNVSRETRVNANSAKGMGQSVRKIQEVGYLLGLMCKYVCEDCDFRIYASPSGQHTKSHVGVSLIEGTILDNMKVVAEKANELGEDCIFPYDYLEDLVRSKRRIDNLLVLSHVSMNPVDSTHSQLANILNKYRSEVNPDLLYVSVDLSGSGRNAIDNDEKHKNDIMISGFSDQILRFIAERGDSTQLQYVEHIDEAKDLNAKLKKEAEPAWEVSPWWRWLDTIGTENDILYPNVVIGKPWRNCRIFISSTFLDMHGERDLLTRIIFPELKERAKQRKVTLHEVDLRWGLTEEEAQFGKTIQLCLDEVARCKPFFVGMLGERYGWAPEAYDVLDHPRFAWLKDYPKGRSITELEMHLAALSNPSQAMSSFFYLRDHSFFSDIPPEHQASFHWKNEDDRNKMQDLKNRIRNSGLPVYDYTCSWGGLSEGKPITAKLEQFCEKVFNDLWGSIQKSFPIEEPSADPLEAEREYHQTFASSLCHNFLGRKNLMDEMTKFVDGARGKLLVVTGKPGDGKSSLLANYALKLAEKDPRTFVLTHFIGAAPGSTDIRKTLSRLCSELKAVFQLDDEIPYTYKDLANLFPNLLEQATFKGKLVVIIDAVNQLDASLYRSHLMEWLPSKLACKFIVSTLEDKTYDALKRRYENHMVDMKMTPLDVKDRTEIVRQLLGQYHKKLDERPMNNQMRVLLRKIDSGIPLYLTVACEELRVFGVYEQISERIKSMGERIPKLFEEVLLRLEGDHGKDLVQDCCSLIIVSRNGLLENELREMVKSDDHRWSGFMRGLVPFLKPTGAEGELQFFHGQFGAAVTKRYVSTQRLLLKYHQRLAETYYVRADPMKDGTWQGGNDGRAIRELPHHLVHAEQWNDLVAVLTDLTFIELKFGLGQGYDLVEDYNEATAVENSSIPNSIRAFKEFVKANVHVLQKNSALTFQQAANQPDYTEPAKEAHKRWNEHLETRAWVKYQNKPSEQDACKMTFSGNQEAITAGCFSNDGKIISAASRDCLIRLYNAETGSEIATLPGHSNWIVDIKFSPDGRQLLSASWDDTLKLWDLDTHHVLYTLKGHNRRVNSCAFSNGGEFIASASWDCTIKLWSGRFGEVECKKTIIVGERPVNTCVFAPDDKKIIAGTWDGKIVVFDVETGNMIATLLHHTKSVSTLAYSPSGKHFVSGGLDRSLMLWDAQAGKSISKLTQHAKPITSVAYSADGTHLLSASADYTTKVWDSNLGQERRTIKAEGLYMFCCSYNPHNSSQLVTGSSECTVLVWDLVDGSQLLKLEGHTRPITCVEYSPDGKRIASSSEDGLLIIWNADTGEKIHSIKGHNAAVTCVAWSPNDNRIATASDDFLIRIWDSNSGKEVLEGPLVGHTSVVRAVCFDPKGALLASGARDNTLRIWDSRNGNQLQCLRSHTDWISCVHFSSNGKKVVTGSWDNSLKIWNLRKGTCSGTMLGHTTCVSSCKFSPDGKTVISSSFDGFIKIWDAESATEITTLTGHTSRINYCCFSHDGKEVASVSDDETIKIWDPLSATEVSTLIGHSDVIRTAAFSPANKQIITSSDDKTLKVWDLSLMKEENNSFSVSTFEKEKKPEVARLSGHSALINSVKLSEDCSKLVSTSDDYTMSIWDVNTNRLIRSIQRSKASESAFKCADFVDARTFISASDDGAVILWDLRSHKKVRVVCQHNAPATSLSIDSKASTVTTSGWDCRVLISDFRHSNQSTELLGHTDWVLGCSTRGNYTVSGGWDNTMKVWNKNSLENNLTGHLSTITSVAISPDRRFFASASYDASVKLWSAQSGKLERTFAGHSLRVNCVDFGPEKENILMSASSDHTVKIYEVGGKLKNEFVCQAPAMYCHSRVTGGDLMMTYGDSIGNLYLTKLMTYR